MFILDFSRFPLIKFPPIICGFSFTQDHKNSLENDLSLETGIEDEHDDEDDNDEAIENPLLVLLLAPETEENEVLEATEGDGETGF